MHKRKKWFNLDNKAERAEFYKENGYESKRPDFEKLIAAFMEKLIDKTHILKIELVGSMTTDYAYPKDVDIAVYIDDMTAVAVLSDAERHTTNITLGMDTWVFDANKNFLGHICQRGPKRCPTNSVECGVPGCGEVKTLKKREGFVFDKDLFFKTLGKVLWERKNGNLDLMKLE